LAMTRAAKQEGLLLSVLVVPALLALAASPFAILVSERYLIVSYPAFVLLLATGVEATVFRSRSILRFSAPALIVGVLFVALERYYTSADFGKAQWRDVAAFVARERSPTDGVILYDGAIESVFRHYYPATLPAPVSTDGRASLDSARHMPRIWLVVAHAPDDGSQVLQQLSTNYAIEKDTVFTRDVGIRVLLLGPH